MRIAFVSYEFPPDTATGGIGTYVVQISQLLRERNIDVDVFCGSSKRSGSTKIFNGVDVHYIKCDSREAFNLEVNEAIKSVNDKTPLSLIEAPEYGTRGLELKKSFPKIPIVIKLHTAAFIIKKLNKHYRSRQLKNRVKKFLNIRYNYKKDNEYLFTLASDSISSPSLSLKDIISRTWHIPEERIIHLPYPFNPKQEFLQIPLATNNNRFGFFGRLETRKGVFNLGKAIPQILQQVSNAECWLVGADTRGPHGEKSMKELLSKLIRGYEHRVKFIDHVPLEKIPGLMEQIDVCVYPSLWENFPNVCLEAMTAGRGIVGSREGGMKDMLEDINGGMLVDPLSVDQIVSATAYLLQNPALRQEMGERARNKIVTYYATSVLDETINYYQNIISSK